MFVWNASAVVYKHVDTKINAVRFSESCFLWVWNVLFFAHRHVNGIYTTSFSIALKFLSIKLKVVLRVFANQGRTQGGGWG